MPNYYEEKSMFKTQGRILEISEQIKISNMERIFRREKSRTEFDSMASKQLRKSRIFYHKNIDVKEARRLFDDAINTDICTRLVTPNLTEFVYSKNGIVKHQAQF